MKYPVVISLLLALLFTFGSCAANGHESETVRIGEPSDSSGTATVTTAEPVINRFLDLPTTANEVDALIASIPAAEIKYETEIDRAFLAYWRLPEEERADVTGFETLQALRRELTKAYVVKEYRDTRIPHERLLIGCYRIPACTDPVLSALVDCHFDLIWDYVDTDMLRRYGLGMIPSAYALQIPALNSEEKFLSSVRDMNLDDETIWCVDLQDEPRLIDMEYLSKVGRLLKREALPSSGYLSNLLPFYAFSDVPYEYGTYIREYFDTIGLDSDFVSVDHYPYNEGNHVKGNSLSSFLNNLDMLAAYCRERGHDLFVILQHIDVMEKNSFSVTTDMMKFQAYASMAYGAKGIHWYAMHRYPYAIVDEDGNRTDLFDRLEEVNRDLKALEPVYMRYTGDGTAVLIHDDFTITPPLEHFYRGSFDVSGLNQTALTDLGIASESAEIVGHFRKNTGDGEAFLFVCCGDYWFTEDQSAVTTFKTADPEAVVTAYRKGIPTLLTPDKNGVYTVEIHGSDAVFVTVD